MNFEQTDNKNIWHPFTSLRDANPPILIESASGIYLKTQDGRSIIDAVSSWWVNLHGHANPAIAEAVSKQALELEHVIFAGFTHKPAIKLSEQLLSILPAGQTKIFFSDDGSTAVEVGIKMALQYWFNQQKPRQKIIAIEGAYHGDTFGAMSVGARSLFTDPFSKLLFDVSFLDLPNENNRTEVVRIFREQVSAGNVAAFIFEPLVQGAAGMRMYPADVLDELIAIGNEYGVLAIADEVFTGFGRTGKIFACDYLKNKPDIVAISKGLTGGALPLGVTSCNQKVLSVFETGELAKTFFHGHSYTANPLACAAALASFDLLMTETCRLQIEMISNANRNFVKKISGHPLIKEARSFGTIMALELRTDDATSYANNLRKKIYRFFIERDILLRPLGNVIYTVPPYVISESELITVQDAIVDFLESENRSKTPGSSTSFHSQRTT